MYIINIYIYTYIYIITCIVCIYLTKHFYAFVAGMTQEKH